MLSKRAQRDILIELLKSSRSEVCVRDDHYLDCQLVMPDRCFLAVFDFKDAVLNANRFNPVPLGATDMLTNFLPERCEVVKPLSLIPPECIEAVIKNKILPLKSETGRLYFMKQKYFRMIHYDERKRTLYVRTTEEGRPVMFYLFDTEKEELDALICPFRILENNNDA